MTYQFPPTIYSRDNTIGQQVNHISEELEEMRYAGTQRDFAMEAIDLYHAVETLLRILERQHGPGWVQDIRNGVERKNRERGYYL